jgi:hypothetical protein
MRARDGELGESRRDAGEPVAILADGLGGDLIVHHAGFDGPSPPHAPAGSDHLFNHGELHAVGELEALQVQSQEIVEALARFGIESEASGEQAVTHSILRRELFSERGGRPTGTSAIGAR